MEVLHRTEKKKRKTKAKTVEQLLHIRRLAADWLTDAEPSALQDYITKPKHRASRLTFRQRAVGLSLQQVSLRFRAIITHNLNLFLVARHAHVGGFRLREL